jgi:septal ring factor EnvC (AmiA/AmiB activator)
MTWRTPASSAYARFRALPVVWQGAAVVLALVALLWLYGALDGAVSGARDWWADRRIAAAEERAADAEQKIAEMEGRINRITEELTDVRAKVEQFEADERRQAEEGAKADATLEQTRQRRRAVRRGDDPDPITSTRELDRRLSDRYAKPQP